MRVSPFGLVVVALTRVVSASWLDSAGLSANNRKVFDLAMGVLDSNFGLPFLWQSPKPSSWYAVALLARGEGDDVQIANKLIANIVTQQYTDPSFVGYGTFKDPYVRPYADGDSLYEAKIYDSYDPNVNLFVTIAGIIIDSQFSDLLDDDVWANLRKAMYIAVDGDGYRVGGFNDDNLRPAYSNPWYMRCVSAAYVGNISGDANMTYWAEEWAKEAVDNYDAYGTMSEFNGGTYAGVSLFALSLAQYCPNNSTIYNAAPRLLSGMWDQIAETYNPSLATLSGPWDRTYGFDLTQYYGILGSAISGIIGLDRKYPMPKPLDGSDHYTDLAMAPMQMLTAPYVESHLSPNVSTKLAKLYSPHMYTAQALSYPYDVRPRNYTFWVDDGWSIGGVEFDESEVGGPSINQPSFSPGVILWDAGKGGTGVGYISYYPTSPSCSIIATSSNLTIRYPPSLDFPNGTLSDHMQLSISALPDFQLSPFSFENGQASLPGLDVMLSGNVVERGNRTLTFTGDDINGFLYYNLTYSWEGTSLSGEIPELVVGITKTASPSYQLIVE